MEDYLNLSALYYDISKPIGTSLDGDLEFYEKHIKEVSSILEAGVGTGRLLIPYLEKGIKMDGIDLSQEMLNICEEKCKEHGVQTRLMQGSVVDYQFDKYDAIIVPTGTFCLFPEIKKVLQNFYETLNSDGFVLFDLIYPEDFKVNERFTYTLNIDENRELLLHDYRQRLDWNAQQTTQLLTYELWESGKLKESELQRFVINWYGILEMQTLLAEVGFKNVELYGNYQEYEQSQEYATITVKAYK